MPDVNDRPQCPPGCGGFLLGTCRKDHMTGEKHHESLIPAQQVWELHVFRQVRREFWRMVARLRELFADDITAFTVDASWRLVRPEFGTA